MAERALPITERRGVEERIEAPASPFSLERGAEDAYWLLRVGFTLAPLLAGLDKFAHVLTDWTQYLAPFLTEWTGLTAVAFMQIVGVIEIVAGICVAWKPKVFAYVVCAWLVGIIVNLLILGQYFDIALRDLGLAIGAFALGRLSQAHERRAAPSSPGGK